jgi:serine/threonine protein kinase
MNEIRIMKELNHPHIVKLERVSQDQRFVYMFLEYMPFGDLLKVQN